LNITNNSPWTVVVNWKGTTGGAVVAANGGTGAFETGYVTLHCDESKDIDFVAGANGTVANYQWKCNSCSVPPI
jgi:hypothetical protein